MERSITFPLTADGEWTNRETHVQIIRRNVDGRQFYEVTYPVGGGHRMVWASARLLASARRKAEDVVRETRYAAALAYVAAAHEDIDRVVAKFEAASRAGSLSAAAAEEIAGHLAAATRSMGRTDHDRGRAWANMAARAIDARTTTPERSRKIQLVREYREITSCGLRSALAMADRYLDTYAEMVGALRQHDYETASNRLFDASYLSPAYMRERATRSTVAAMEDGRRYVVGEAHAEALRMQPPAPVQPEPPVVITDVQDWEGFADWIRDSLRRGVIGDDGALLALMGSLGVTYDGAFALLDAESTAALA